jgi:hypothetical protein
MRRIEGQCLQTDHGSLHTNLYLCIMHDHSLPYSRLITTVQFNYLNQPSSLFLWAVTQRRLVVTYITGQPIDPIFLDCLTLEDGINRLSRNVGNYQSTLRNIPDERWSHLHRAWSLKSRCRSVTWQQLCMSDAHKFTQLLVFCFTYTNCGCVCARMRARVLTNKLYTHIHTVLHTYTETITIVGTVGRRVRIVNRLMSAVGGKKLHCSSVHCKSHVD